jgi:uncharacterized RDD family membrane protein YckC
VSSFQPTEDSWRPTGPTGGPRAGFWQRFFADVIDGFVLLVIYLISATALHTAGDAIFLVVSFVYFTLLEGGASGQTLGKRAMRIRVASLEGGYVIGYQRAFIRTLGRIVSYIPFGLGYFWMLWSPERQTWHDMMSSSAVVPTALEPRPMW